MNPPTQSRRGRLVPRLLIGILGLLCVAFVWLGWHFVRTNAAMGYNPFEPPGMAAARQAPRAVVGDLGGMPVTVPKYFANFAGYNGDPGFGEKRQGPKPERTHQSKLTGFSFPVRYPDMAGLSSPELEKDKAGYTIHNTPWIKVMITTGEHFGDGLFLERMAKDVRTSDSTLRFHFEKLPQQQFGLDVFSPTNVDPLTHQPGGHVNFHDRDIFVHYDTQGRVDAYIRCSNVNHAAAPCSQDFALPAPLKVWLQVSYRRGLLPEWQQMQSSVTKLVLSFQAQQPAAAGQ